MYNQRSLIIGKLIVGIC